jgi:hypothetical protein
VGRVTLYLDRETEARIKAAAKAEKKSLSRWVADALRKQAAREWPASVLRLAGAWKDCPSAAPGRLRPRASGATGLARQSGLTPRAWRAPRRHCSAADGALAQLLGMGGRLRGTSEQLAAR